jgi:hypothetical protein
MHRESIPSGDGAVLVEKNGSSGKPQLGMEFDDDNMAEKCR